MIAAAGPAAAAADDAVQAQATLHLRATSTRSVPSSLVLFDPGLSTFAVVPYLLPEGSERYGSAFASIRVEGRLLHGALRWVFAADTGELRREAFPKVLNVCLVPRTRAQTGLVLEPSTGCGVGNVAVPLELTQLDAPQLVSNGRPFRDEVRHTLLVREAYAAWSFGRAGFATVRAGRKRTSIADGYVHDDYSTGVELELGLGAIGPRWDLSVGLFQPTRDFPSTVGGVSPVAFVRADWLPSLFEHAGLFVAGLRDRSSSIAELVRSSVVESGVGNLARSLGTAGEAA